MWIIVVFEQCQLYSEVFAMLLRQSNGKIDCLENASNSPIQIVHNESKKHMNRANVFFLKKLSEKINLSGGGKLLILHLSYNDSPICSVNLGRFKAVFIVWHMNVFGWLVGWATEMMPKNSESQTHLQQKHFQHYVKTIYSTIRGARNRFLFFYPH